MIEEKQSKKDGQEHEQSPQAFASNQPSTQIRADSNEKAVTLIQKHLRACRTRIKLKPIAKKIVRRRKIIQQLIETEQNYIRDLGFIISDFKMRLISSKILDKTESDALFANVDEIRKLHEDFFTTLYNHFLQYKPYRIIFADILKIILFFRIYVEYLNNFPIACELIQQFKKDKPAFASFVKGISHSQKYRFLCIEDYLVKPVQRLPKYILLLKEVLKNTQPCHPDYLNIAKALQKFQQVNTNNNDKLTQISNNFKLVQIVHSLKLPEETMAPGVQFILQQCVQVLNQEQNFILSNCVMYLLNNAVIISRRFGSLGNTCSAISTIGRLSSINPRSSIRNSNKPNRTSSCCNYNFFKQKLEGIVPIKHGTSLLKDQNMCFYKNTLTVQSAEGDSCTFICESQQDLSQLRVKLKKQIDRAENEAAQKLNLMFKTDKKNDSFLKKMAMLELIPDVNVLGTSERNDKMLKYTVYIIEIKVKMIRQKIFVRFSELLQIQKYIQQKYKEHFQLKQSLVGCSWIKNHQEKIIEERKMNIQRFLKQLLSKPMIINNGGDVLVRLGLPRDFYELPEKLCCGKNSEEYLKKSSFAGKGSSILKTNYHTQNNGKKKITVDDRVSNYRLSIFQQQKIEEEEEELDSDTSEEEEEESFEKVIKFSSAIRSVNPKSSHGSLNPKKISIQDILKANELNLGHYTRYSEEAEQPIIHLEDESHVELKILIPSIQHFFSGFEKSNRKNSNSFSKVHKQGFRQIKIKVKRVQRIQCLISQIAKMINLKYFKDFRLFIEKQYSQRVLDDDELVHKVLLEVQKSYSCIIFRKMIFIDQETEQKQMKVDRERLKIIASQIVNQIKKGKYTFSYDEYLKFSVLSAIIYTLVKKKNRGKLNPYSFKKNGTDPDPVAEDQDHDQDIKILAREAKSLIFPKYTSLSQTEQVWVTDFIRSFKIILRKLDYICNSNRSTLLEFNSIGPTGIDLQIEGMSQKYQQCESPTLRAGLPTESSIRYLALLSIVKQILKVEPELFGCVSYPVQISSELKQYLDINRDSFEVSTRSSGSKSRKSISILYEEEARNCWLEIKYNKIFLMSIGLTQKLLQIPYENLTKIEPYATCIILKLRNMAIQSIKLKTTSSYYIREIIIYYRNYNQVYHQMCIDPDLCNSIIVMSQEELVHSGLGDVEEAML